MKFGVKYSLHNAKFPADRWQRGKVCQPQTFKFRSNSGFLAGRREVPIIVKFSREEHTVRAICRCKMGDPAPLKRGTSPHFLAHVYCGQTAGWIKMPLGMEVGLGPCHILLDGDPARPKWGAQPFLQFSAHVYCAQTVAHLSCC